MLKVTSDPGLSESSTLSALQRTIGTARTMRNFHKANLSDPLDLVYYLTTTAGAITQSVVIGPPRAMEGVKPNNSSASSADSRVRQAVVAMLFHGEPGSRSAHCRCARGAVMRHRGHFDPPVETCDSAPADRWFGSEPR